MKSRHQFSQEQVARNLDYLLEQGFVKQISTPRTFTTTAGTRQSAEKITYKIAKAGIDRLEGSSEFHQQSPYAGVNIVNVHGVVAVGNSNSQTLVQGQFETALNRLDQLEAAVRKSDLRDADKLQVIADIETVKSQLAKPSVNHSIVREAWAGVEKAVTAGETVDLVVKLAQLLAPILSGSPTLPF